jgi:hypothetical protein
VSPRAPAACSVARSSRPSGVGYFWQDDSTREEIERIKIYERANAAAGTDRLRWFLNEGVQLPADLSRLTATIRAHDLGLVCLDSFYNFVTVDLKDSQAEQIVATLKREIADQLGCTVLIVDHMPWPTDANRQRLRAYGGVFKNAATRFGIYIDAVGKNLSIEARGNNIRGFKRRPACWDDQALELRLVESATLDKREAAEADALAWIIEHVTAHYLATGAGIPRGRVESAFHAAHVNHGRNLARRIIDRELALAGELLNHDDGRDHGETPPALAVTTGETAHGIYLIPFSHALPPIAATLAGETDETAARPIEQTPLAGLAAPSIREGADRPEVGEGETEPEVERLADLARDLEERL